MRQPEDTSHIRLSQSWLGLVALLVGACTAQVVPGSNGGGDATGGTGACVGAACGTAGSVAAGGSGTAGAVGMAGSPPVVPGDTPMRRLNNAEYQNTLTDLFGSSGTKVRFPDDARSEGYDTLSTALAVSPLHTKAYLDAAIAVVDELFTTDPGAVRAGFCDYNSADAAANLTCAQKIVSDFATRAWRRPLTAWHDEKAETEELALLQPAGPLGMLPLDVRLRSALEAVLISPRFIFRVELTNGAGALDTPSLASRLSYFLWSSAPDAALLGSDLQQGGMLDEQVARMQQSAGFARFLARFPQMWLELEKLDSVDRDLKVYPNFTKEVVQAMGEETRGFFASYWKDPTAKIGGILLAPHAPVTNPALTKIYGDSPRLGLATQASIMTLTGATARTSPVRRGKWVLERLLCSPPPPPPANVKTDDITADPTLSERERLARHRANPTCAGCHNLMDPIGLGFENYDALGAYRTMDAANNPVDASGAMPGSNVPFKDVTELIGLLANDARLQGCVARQLLTYSTGRKYDGNDDAAIETLRTAAGGTDATFQRVLTSVIQSDAFRRRVEEK